MSFVVCPSFQLLVFVCCTSIYLSTCLFLLVSVFLSIYPRVTGMSGCNTSWLRDDIMPQFQHYGVKCIDTSRVGLHRYLLHRTRTHTREHEHTHTHARIVDTSFCCFLAAITFFINLSGPFEFLKDF